jgi:hypothetical protein
LIATPGKPAPTLVFQARETRAGAYTELWPFFFAQGDPERAARLPSCPDPFAPIDVDEARYIPFGLSLSKPFDKLRANGGNRLPQSV